MSWPNVILDDAQKSKLNEWMAKHAEAYTGAIGGRYTFSCTPTSLGQVLKVADSVTNTELDISDYDGW